MKKSRPLVIKFLTPAIVFFALVYVYPMAKTVAMSFFNVENITGNVSTWKFTGVGNYIQLMKTTVFVKSLVNLFKIWIIGGIFVLAISLLFAVILNSGIKGKKFFRNVIYMPYTLSAVAMATMWLQYVYNSKYGLLTNLFTKLGMDSLAAIQWTDPAHKFGAMLIAYCFGMVGYHMVIFSSGIEKIPSDYYDACSIDGCSSINKFCFVTWPLLRGELKTNITMWSISAIGFFAWSQMFTGQGSDTATITPIVYLYTQIFGAVDTVTQRNAGVGAAVGVITGILVVVTFILTNIAFKNDDIEL